MRLNHGLNSDTQSSLSEDIPSFHRHLYCCPGTSKASIYISLLHIFFMFRRARLIPLCFLKFLSHSMNFTIILASSQKKSKCSWDFDGKVLNSKGLWKSSPSSPFRLFVLAPGSWLSLRHCAAGLAALLGQVLLLLVKSFLAVLLRRLL